MRRTSLLLIVVLLSSAVSSSILAGQPFFTDDPQPDELHHGEFYIAAQSAWTSDGLFNSLPQFEFDYGILKDVQFHLVAPLDYQRSAALGVKQYGYGQTELGLKWRLLTENALFDGSPQVGTFPLVEVPTFDNTPGAGYPQFFLPLWLQKSFGPVDLPWTIYGGGGYWINPGEWNKNYWFTGVVLQKQVTKKLMLGGELANQTHGQVDGSSDTGFNLGGVYDLSPTWHLLFSAGRDFHGPIRLSTYAGLLYTF